MRARLWSMMVVSAAVVASTDVDAQEIPRVALVVGQTVELPVGWALGYICDDTAILRAELYNRDPYTNIFAITGIEPGTTLCRVGTNQLGATSYLFEVVVVPAPTGW